MNKDCNSKKGFFEETVELHQSGQWELARQGYLKILEKESDHSGALHYLGVLCFQTGDCQSAFSLLSRAIELEPDEGETHEHLGLVLLELGYAPEAEAEFRQALELTVDLPRASIYSNLAFALLEQGKASESEKYCKAALALLPDYGEALNNLGLALTEQGRFQEAEKSFRRGIKIQPTLIKAYAGLAELVIFKADDPAISSLEAICNKNFLGFNEQIMGHFTLGKMYGYFSDWDASFRHYTSGNTLRGQQGPRFDSKNYRKNINRLIATCDAEYFMRHSYSDSVCDSKLPVFIVGMPRSGTTLVEQILASHSAVDGAGELPFVMQLAWQVFKKDSGSLVVPDRDFLQTELRTLSKTYLQKILGKNKKCSENSRVVNKMPHNFEYLWLISVIFPQATIIHCKRDPYDTCLSCYFSNFRQPHPYKNHLSTLGDFYRQYQRLMTHWKSVLPVSVFDVSYEELIHNQKSVSRALIEFCGLKWEPECLEFFRNTRHIKTPSALQVRKSLYSSSIGKWNNYEKFLKPLGSLEC